MSHSFAKVGFGFCDAVLIVSWRHLPVLVRRNTGLYSFLVFELLCQDHSLSTQCVLLSCHMETNIPLAMACE
jgi:hypothetical protein